MTLHQYKGRCLCGAVSYIAQSEYKAAGACHCTDCLRWMGGPFISLDCSSLDIEGPVRWFSSSDHAERGSCSQCGAALFWRMKDGSYPTVTAGSLDDPTVLEPVRLHIFIDEKPSFYDFTGDAPRQTGKEVLAKFMAQMKDGGA